MVKEFFQAAHTWSASVVIKRLRILRIFVVEWQVFAMSRRPQNPGEIFAVFTKMPCFWPVQFFTTTGTVLVLLNVGICRKRPVSEQFSAGPANRLTRAAIGVASRRQRRHINCFCFERLCFECDSLVKSVRVNHESLRQGFETSLFVFPSFGVFQ